MRYALYLTVVSGCILTAIYTIASALIFNLIFSFPFYFFLSFFYGFFTISNFLRKDAFEQTSHVHEHDEFSFFRWCCGRETENHKPQSYCESNSQVLMKNCELIRFDWSDDRFYLWKISKTAVFRFFWNLNILQRARKTKQIQNAPNTEWFL